MFQDVPAVRVDQARRDGYDFYVSAVVVVNMQLDVMGVRGFETPFPPLPHRCGTHAAMACRLNLARQVGYNPHLTTFGQIGEDVNIVFELALQHNGKFDPDPMMINMVGNEYSVYKARDSRRIKLAFFHDLYDRGLLKLPEADFRRMMRKERFRHAMILLTSVCPAAYPIITRFRFNGPRQQEISLTQAQRAFLDEIRLRFPPGQFPADSVQATAGRAAESAEAAALEQDVPLTSSSPAWAEQ